MNARLYHKNIIHIFDLSLFSLQLKQLYNTAEYAYKSVVKLLIDGDFQHVCFVGSGLIDLPSSFRVTSPGQYHDCLSNSETTLTNMGKVVTGIPKLLMI